MFTKKARGQKTPAQVIVSNQIRPTRQFSTKMKKWDGSRTAPTAIKKNKIEDQWKRKTGSGFLNYENSEHAR
jgi:hypothetical protein